MSHFFLLYYYSQQTTKQPRISESICLINNELAAFQRILQVSFWNAVVRGGRTRRFWHSSVFLIFWHILKLIMVLGTPSKNANKQRACLMLRNKSLFLFRISAVCFHWNFFKNWLFFMTFEDNTIVFYYFILGRKYINDRVEINKYFLILNQLYQSYLKTSKTFL